LENEYGAKCIFEPKSYYKACWITTTDPAKLTEFLRIKGNNIVKDKEERDVFLAPSQFMLDMEKQNYPELSFHFTSELDA
jgi:peptide chain release factor 3